MTGRGKSKIIIARENMFKRKGEGMEEWGAEGVGSGRDFQGFNPRRRIQLFNISVPYCRYSTFVDEVLILSFFL